MIPVTGPRSHPSVFMILIMPYGALNGYLSVTLGYLLSQSGMAVAQIGLLIAVSYLPQTWKFLWAPIVDTTLTRKRWYVIGTTLTSIGIIAMAACSTKATAFSVLSVVVFVASLASSFTAMSTESLLAYNTAPALKGRAGGWLQAGSLGGMGLGGGAGLWLAQRVSTPWMTGAALGLCFMLCCAALLVIAEPATTLQEHGPVRKTVALLRDLWGALRARSGYLALLIVFLPIGTGAASNYWSAVADDWHASASIVALVNGALGGLASAVGCLVGGYLADYLNRRLAYLGYGVLLALCGLSMALCPHTERAYMTFTLVYAVINGMCFAAFSAVTLEAIGLGAAATKYNLYASLSNIPITYMTALEGPARDRWGTNGFLYFEGVMTVVSVVVFVTATLLTARRTSPLAAEPA
jgi:MFS transporter, PAT family, beta-lactamase induction signal transducer AmpG